jgi:Phage integrase family
MANLRHCSAHGLRKAAARRLAEAGCTEHEIAAITGHASLREVARYTKAADQKRLAAAAMGKVKSENIKWLTFRRVSQFGPKRLRNQRPNMRVATRHDYPRLSKTTG